MSLSYERFFRWQPDAGLERGRKVVRKWATALTQGHNLTLNSH